MLKSLAGSLSWRVLADKVLSLGKDPSLNSALVSLFLMCQQEKERERERERERGMEIRQRALKQNNGDFDAAFSLFLSPSLSRFLPLSRLLLY